MIRYALQEQFNQKVKILAELYYRRELHAICKLDSCAMK